MDNNYNESRLEQWRVELRNSLSPKERAGIERVEMPQLDAAYRITCNEEVNQGITEEQAVREASRCLDCANPQCVTGCPVGINIPKFIKNIERRHFADAAEALKETSTPPWRSAIWNALQPIGNAIQAQKNTWKWRLPMASRWL